MGLPNVRPVDRVQALSGIPILVIHGTRDDIIDAQHARRLAQSAGKTAKLVLVSDGGHAEELYRHEPDNFLRLVQDRLDETVQDRTLGEGAQRVRVRHGYFRAAEGVWLHTRRWVPESARMPLVLMHGAGEHSGRYDALACRLAQEGFSIHAFDARGHGTSPGRRGDLRLNAGIDDLHAFISDDLPPRCAGARPVLLGHSLGGLLATWYAAEHPDQIRALALSSPLWRLNVRVPLWKRFVARLLARAWPSLTMRRPTHSRFVLSHDPDVERLYFHDPLVHFYASIGLYRDILDRTARLPGALARIKLPALILQAGDDRIASAEAVRLLAPEIGGSDVSLRIFDGWFHEVFNEVGREGALRQLLDWLRAQEPTNNIGD
jgi:alpha-beta hydrolase superfamily lysophospholipase